MKTPTRVLALLSVLFIGAACSESIKVAEPQSGITDTNSGQGLGDSPSTPPAPGSPANSWDGIKQKADGVVEGSSFDGQLLVQIDSVNQAVIVYLPIPFPNLMLPVQGFDIPQLPGASVFQVNDANGNTKIAVRIPLRYLIKGAQLAPYNMLPNGDPLPFMPVGENRGFAIQFPQMPEVRLSLYVSANAAAAYIEIPALKLPDEWLRLTLGFPIKNSTGTQVVGYMAFVPNKGVYPSGVFVASRFPREIAAAIDDLLRY